MKLQLLHTFLWVFCIFTTSLNAQTYWGSRSGGLTIEEANSVCTDLNGNTYVTGYFTGSCTFQSQTVNSSGLSDVFVAKYSPTGALTWVIRLGGNNNDRGNGIACDASGNVYVTGYFYGSAGFGSYTLNSFGQQDAFLAKLDASGTVLWVKQGGGTGADLSNDVTTDNLGNAIIIGTYNGNATFGAYNINSQSDDIFIVKYDASGTEQWVKNGTAPNSDMGFAISCDQNNNVVATGQFSQTITFDVTHPNTTNNSIFVVKFNAAGQEQWFNIIGGATNNISHDIGCDNSGNVYVTGDFTGNLYFFPNLATPLTNPYPNRIFIAKYSSAGALQWSQCDGSDSEVSSTSIAVSSTGLNIAGNFKCKFSEYADQYGQGIFNSVGFNDCFTALYDLSGNRQWMRQWGGKKDDYCHGITYDNNSKPVFCGSFECNLSIPSMPGWLFYPNYTDTAPSPANTCGDPNYYLYQSFTAIGNKDIFVGRFIDPTRKPYDYYYRNSTSCNLPFVPGCINDQPGNDFYCSGNTVQICGNIPLFAATKTDYSSQPSCHGIGPDYTYLWSTGATSSTLNVLTAGNYSVTITTADGCFSSSDTIYADVLQTPQRPLISDNAGVNQNAVFPDSVLICAPGSVTLTAGGTNGNNFQWSGGTPNNPNLVVTSTGNYTVVVTGPNGCVDSNTVRVVFENPLPPIAPELFLFNDPDHNDSIIVCEDTPIFLGIYDTIANPNMLPAVVPNLTGSCTFTPYNLTGSVVSNPTYAGYTYTTTNPTQTATYVCDCDFIYANSCDTVHYNASYTFYVEVLPAPQVDIVLTGPSILCPGETGYYAASGSSSYVWFANSVYTNNFDTIGVNTAQTVYVSTSVQGPNGCWGYDSESLAVSVATQPQLNVTPATGIICPNDSVQLTCSGPGQVLWYGPSGLMADTAHVIYVDVPGSYYSAVIMNPTCTLLTNTIVITQYTTPFLSSDKPPIICSHNDSITLNVVTSQFSTVQWINPPGETGFSVTVDNGGWYICSILTPCGNTVIDSIYIAELNPQAGIANLEDSLFCDGDTITLHAIQGPYTYLWSPNAETTDSILVFTPGTFYVEVTDTMGCKNSSDPFPVSLINDQSFVPIINDKEFCPDDQVLLVATVAGFGTVSWYADINDSIFIWQGDTFLTPVLSNSVTYYLDLSYDGCYGVKIPVEILALECDSLVIPDVFTPNGDGTNDGIDFSLPGGTCFNLYIYNRWGGLIFESHELNTIWYGESVTGSKLVEGVYFYVVDYCPKDLPPKKQAGFIHLFE